MEQASQLVKGIKGFLGLQTGDAADQVNDVRHPTP